jgi:hypothetical protein
LRIVVRNQGRSMNDEKEGWVPIEVLNNLEEMFAAMTSYAGEKVGWCLLCNGPIQAEADMIPGTSTHDCELGRALEATIKSHKAKSRCRPGRRVRANHRKKRI